MNDHSDPRLQTFESESLPVTPGTPAAARPADRPREVQTAEPVGEPELVTFECVAEVPPPGTPAAPRPAGKPRELVPTPTEADAAFAKELADRMLEYVQTRSAGLTPEQLAALVQQFLSRRSA